MFRLSNLPCPLDQALEPKARVEALRMLVSRINDKRPRRHDARCRRRTENGVLQQSSTGGLSLVALIDGELAELRAGNRVRSVSAQRTGECPDARDRMGAQSVEATNLPRNQRQNVHSRGPVSHRTMRALLEPGVVVAVARAESAQVVLVEQRANATKC